MPNNLDKAYEAKKYEDKIYSKWENSGFFNPDKCIEKGICDKDADPFSIVLPPPNATGHLHIGHAMMLAIEDLMIRYHRMKGDKTLWIPGTDHAAIATNAVVERQLIKEGKSKHDLGRDKYVNTVKEYISNSQETIRKQVRKMGASLDWSREAYTWDEKRGLAVRTMFKKMYDDGLIYRGNRIVNWCPHCHSTLADDEVEYKEENGKFYWIKYGPFVLATARPETKLGDTAVAVHPSDERYKDMVGKKYMIPGVLGEFEVIVVADEAVDPEFGTGAVKVTPAHSFTDYEIAQRHGVAIKQIINEDGKMMENCGKYTGMTTKEARKTIVTDMEKMGLIDHIEDNYKHNLSVCYRCKHVIEPIPSKQWFIDVNKEFKFKQSKNNPIGDLNDGQDITLRKLMQHVVQSGQIDIVPSRFNKVYFNWVDNLRDWCISRQIWVGHQMPVWSRSKSDGVEDEIYVGIEAPNGDGWVQDSDTLDTWFSAGLWTFSTLGWPNKPIDIIAARHGVTDAHGNGVFIGQETDVELNQKGIEQAEKLSEQLKNENIDYIISSDLKRCSKTAEIVNKHHNLDIIYDKRLREYDFGFMAGKNLKQLREKYPDMPGWKDLDIDNKYKDEESPLEVKKRVNAFLNDAKIKYGGKKIFICTSGGVMDFMDMICNDKKFDEIKTLHHEKGGIERYKYINSDLDIYHPTAVLETMFDIIFFWVARMIMMSTYALGEVPFKTVYLHSRVLDRDGEKMSKSKPETMIDPLDVCEKYGTDAVRLSLLLGVSPGSDVRLSYEKIEGFRNFANKLWNISRFMLMNIKEPNIDASKPEPKTIWDKWILSKLNYVISTTDIGLSELSFSQVGDTLHDFTWNELADWYLEATKIEGDKSEILNYILNTLLKLWHPYMPFVTETIWQEVYGDARMLMIEKWPENLGDISHMVTESRCIDELIRPLIVRIRHARAQNRIDASKKISVLINAGEDKELLEQNAEMIKKLQTNIDKLEIQEVAINPGNWYPIEYGRIEVFVDLSGTVDKEKIQLEIEKISKYINSLDKKLSNKQFVDNAPEDVVVKEKEKYEEAKQKIDKLNKQLNNLK